MIKCVFFALIAVLTISKDCFSSEFLYANDWDRQSTYLEGAYAALAIVDMIQTKNIQYHQPKVITSTNWTPSSNGGFQSSIVTQGVSESNPILGSKPKSHTVIQYFTLTTIAHAYVSSFLPQGPRLAWQLSTIALEVSCIQNNYKLKLSGSF